MPARTQVPARIGRPTKYSTEWAEQFCARIAEGQSVAEICGRRDQPSQQSVYTWLREDDDFLERYARAREAQADLFFKEMLEIADRGKDSENESQARIQRDRLRVDTRKWMAARLAPKKYGDRVSHDVQGNTTLNFQPAVLINVGPADVSPAPEAGIGVLLDGDIVRER